MGTPACAGGIGVGVTVVTPFAPTVRPPGPDPVDRLAPAASKAACVQLSISCIFPDGMYFCFSTMHMLCWMSLPTAPPNIDGMPMLLRIATALPYGSPTTL